MIPFESIKIIWNLPKTEKLTLILLRKIQNIITIIVIDHFQTKFWPELKLLNQIIIIYCGYCYCYNIILNYKRTPMFLLLITKGLRYASIHNVTNNRYVCVLFPVEVGIEWEVLYSVA